MKTQLTLSVPRGVFAAGASALLAILPWSQQLDASAQDPARRDPPSPQEQIAKVSERFEGVWQLVGGSLGATSIAGGDRSGYLIVRPGYMALEIHLVVRARDQRNNVPAFQSGTYRWRFVNATQLEASCLIGTSNYNQDNRWRFEQPGSSRRMIAVVSETTLTLDQGSTSKLQFRRVPELPYPGRQVGFEGRGVKDKKEDGGQR